MCGPQKKIRTYFVDLDPYVLPGPFKWKYLCVWTNKVTKNSRLPTISILIIIDLLRRQNISNTCENIKNFVAFTPASAESAKESGKL